MAKKNTTLINALFFEDHVKGTQFSYSGVNYDCTSMDKVKEFLCVISGADKSTVGKWFTDIDKASWLGVSDSYRERIEEVFGECAHEQGYRLFYPEYDYNRFRNILMFSVNLKFNPVEKAALSVMLRRPFSWVTIEDILEVAQEFEPRFKHGAVIRERLLARPDFYSYQENGDCFRLQLENVISFILNTPGQ